MKRLRISRLRAGAICLVLIAAIAGCLFGIFRPEPLPDADALAGWTVMVYMVGSDLERDDGLGTRSLQAMRQALRPGTRLLAMTGSSPDNEGSLFGEACRLYQMSAAGESLLETFPGSLCDPEPLSRLLAVGAQVAQGPTALILWDHGFGPMGGFGYDPLRTDGRRLSLADLAGALRENGYDKHPLTVAGFDACLMSGCETALTLAPYARYLLASQETIPKEGWDYSFLETLSPETDGEAFGRAAIACFTARYRRLYSDYPSSEQPYSLSLIDLSGTDALAAAADAFFGALLRDVKAGNFPAVSQLRQKPWSCGRVILRTEYDTVDLAQLAREATGTYPEAAAVPEALARCVVHSDGNEPGAGGLSVFFPQLADPADLAEWLTRLDTMPLPQNWRAFMHAYSDALAADPPMGQAAAVPGDPFSARLDETGLRDFLRAKYYVLEGTPKEGMRLLCAGDDWTLSGDTVTVRWNRRTLSLSSGDDVIPLVAFPILRDGEHAYRYAHAVVYDDAVPVSARLRAVLDTQKGTWRVLSAIPSGGDEPESGRKEIPLSRITTILSYSDRYLPVLDWEGRTLPWTEWVPTGSAFPDQLNVTGDLSLTETDLPDGGGPYWLQIVIVDTYNRQYAAPLMPLDGQA